MMNLKKSINFYKVTMITCLSVGINGISRKICNGSPRCCSETNKCGEMEGDCNSDFDCLDGLR